MWEKRFGERMKRRNTWKWRRGKNVCDCRFLLILPGRLMWLSRTLQYLIRSCHLSTLFLHNKGEHLRSLFISLLFLPEQYVAGRERWQEERERGGKTYSTNSIYSHSSTVTGFSSSNLSISHDSAYLGGEAEWRRLISARTVQLPFLMMQGRFKWAAFWFEMWMSKCEWNQFFEGWLLFHY